jgi:3',5'-cyclic AMP phosphodiesterase CpdA
MSSIRILHASDLHIAVTELRRSIKDAASDAKFAAMRLDPKATFKALRKIALASSFDSQILEDLAEVIVHNAKHVKPDVRQFTEDFARQRHFVYLKEKLDAVVFTGDLATTGLKDDLEQVKLFLQKDYHRGSPHRPKDPTGRIATLSAVNTTATPVICLPGNHDRYWLPLGFPAYLPGSEEFDVEVLDYKNEPVRRFPIPPSGNLQVVIFAADFTLKRRRHSRYGVGWIAQGRIYHGKGSTLEKLVADTENEIAVTKPGTQLCILWALHFPPEFPQQSRLSMLIDEDKLLEQADKLGVHGILAGHTHDQKKYRDTDPKKCPVFCCGATTQHEPVTSLEDLAANSPRENLFQVLTVSTKADGAIDIQRDEYRYGPIVGEATATEKHWHKFDSGNARES